MKNFILTLLSETPHEPNSSNFLSGLGFKTTTPEKHPKDFNQWVRYMSRLGVKWHEDTTKRKETKTINLTSR